jgi:hypothetical protein
LTASITEFFKNPKCSIIECNVKFVNDRLKDAFTWIPYLEKNIELIENSLPPQFLETQEGFANNSDSRLLKKFGQIETIYKEVFAKQTKIKVLLGKINKKIVFPKREPNTRCFQIETPDECNGDDLKKQIQNIYNKLDEIEYRTDRLYVRIEKELKRLKEFEDKKNAAIDASSKQANATMSKLFGFNVDLKMDKFLKAGITGNLKKGLESAAKGDLSGIKDMVNSKEVQDMVKNINTKSLLNNLDGMSPSSSSSFLNTGNNLLSSSMSSEDDPDADRARDALSSAKKKIKLPF